MYRPLMPPGTAGETWVRWFRPTLSALFCLLVACGLASCNTPGGAQAASIGTGAVIGAGIGAGIGAAFHDPALGAAIGGAVGAGVGTSPALAQNFKSSQLKFQEAVLHGDLERARQFANGKYINVPIRGFPPVFYAAANGDVPMLTMLYQFGASLRYYNNGRSLAYIAGSFGYPEAARSIASMSGGSQADAARGIAAFQANQREQRRLQREAIQQGLAEIAAQEAAMNGGYPPPPPPPPPGY